MPDRPDDAQDEASKTHSGGLTKPFLRSRLSRHNGMDARGLAASSIGIVLAVSIGLGFALGSWLDGRYGTSYWTPVMLLLGIGAGFREIFHIIRPILKKSQQEQAGWKQANKGETASTGFVKPKGAPLGPEATETGERPRSFRIPAPPSASFDKQGILSEEPAKAGSHSREVSEDVDDISTLTERLLKENDDRPSSL